MHMCSRVLAATHTNVDTLKIYLGQDQHPLYTILTMLHWRLYVV
jgi:hypothetical protein